MFLATSHLGSQHHKYTSTSKYKIQKNLSLNQRRSNLNLSLLNMSCGCMGEVDKLRRLHACPKSMIVDGRSCLCGIQESIVEIEEDHEKGYVLELKELVGGDERELQDWKDMMRQA
jgi:hypothetical protein